MSNKLIDLIDISKSYGMQTVLDELNLYIRENEFLTYLVRVDVERLLHFVFWEDSRHRIKGV